MKCIIRSNNVEVSQSFREQVNKRIQHSFGRVRDKVRCVIVSFKDINGKRGGVDQQCQVKVIGKNQVDVHVVNINETPQAAFSMALLRAQFTFVNRLKRILGKVRRKYATKAYKDVQLLQDSEPAI